jgi:hypothetical protein
MRSHKFTGLVAVLVILAPVAAFGGAHNYFCPASKPYLRQNAFGQTFCSEYGPNGEHVRPPIKPATKVQNQH